MSESSTPLPLEAQHTPIPWRLARHCSTVVENEAGECIADVYASCESLKPTPAESTEARENAALIVRACNNHASLLEALRNTQETIAEQHPGTMETCSCPLAERFRANEKAIRDAEGKI